MQLSTRSAHVRGDTRAAPDAVVGFCGREAHLRELRKSSVRLLLRHKFTFGDFCAKVIACVALDQPLALDLALRRPLLR